MALAKITYTFSRFKGAISGRNRSSTRLIPASVASTKAGSVANTFSFSGRKNPLRLSSSLQDLSMYRDLDGNALKQSHLWLRENAVSSFPKEGSLTGRWARLLLFFLCLMLVGQLMYATSTYIYTNWSREASKYYVVLDCGSTGTRVYAYQASLSYRTDGGLPVILRSFNEGNGKKQDSRTKRAYDRMETEPGFDKLVHNVSGLRDAISPLIQWAEQQIPQQSHKSTSLFLYATAGVRRLPPDDSQWLLDNAWTMLKMSPFLCERDWVKIISGTQEAYYGWVALNYHTGMLDVMPKRGTLGALDLGGSSLQVTFEGRENVHENSGIKLRIGVADHYLNAYSLSGYGLNDAFDKSVSQIFRGLPEGLKVDSVNGNLELKHPCLQSGYKERYICSQCGSHVKEGGSPVIGDSMGQGDNKLGISLQLRGAPKWEECRELAKMAVNLSEWSSMSPGLDCDIQPCALSEDLPHPYGQFHAMSGFFVVYRFFNLSKDATLDGVLEKGREFCEKTWESAKSSVPPQPFIEQYCFRASYIASLLREGLHITDTQITIDSGSITWTLGVALLEAGQAFPLQARLRRYQILWLNINPTVLVIILLLPLLILAFALSWGYNWMPKFFWRPYLPLFRHKSASAASALNVHSLKLQRWRPVNLRDRKFKTPLSPINEDSQHLPIRLGHGVGGSCIQLTDLPLLYPPAGGVSHSFSSSSLRNMQFNGTSMTCIWSPRGNQMHLQSRRSQSREELSSSIAEA
ncbi:hypothetical protein SAY87_015345 [Trapa incisa]|uniref:apyrase n=1 Tax=Trapa incisa TaxID=236973 RepID=A0AAN7GU30_9MYRT|nr:hypothetical protein SAY87_015345 [Trapa incisa]